MLDSRETKPSDRGFCVCLDCGMRVPGQRGVTCLEMNCPNCGAVLVRENSPYCRYVMRRWFEADLRAVLARRGIELEPSAEPVSTGAHEGPRVLQEASVT